MKICPNCKEHLDDGESFCHNCRMRVKDVPVEVDAHDVKSTPVEEQTTYQNNNCQNNQNDCYQSTVKDSQEPTNKDEPEMWMRVVSWFIPLVGIIYYFLERKNSPNKAKSYIQASLIGLAVSIIISIILYCGLILGFFGMLGGVMGGFVSFLC